MQLQTGQIIDNKEVVNIDMLDPYATKEIYKDFISGKVINKNEMDNGELRPSIKFSELIKHIDLYKKLYGLLGFELIAIGNESYYIVRPERDTLNEIGANIQVILIILCRGLATRGISPEILKDPTGGINAQIIDEIGSEEESARILKACDITTPLTKSIENIMVDRALMYKTSTARYILSNAGYFMYWRLLEDSITNQY